MKRSIDLSCRALATVATLTTALASAEVRAASGEGAARTSERVATRLEWIREVGAESCVTAEQLRRLLAQVLGRDAAPSALGDSVIEGLVSRGTAQDTWQARVRIVAADGSVLGQRELSTRQPLCSAITPSVLLVLLMLVDPEAADRGLPSEVVQAITDQADAEAEALETRTSAPAAKPSEAAPASPPSSSRRSPAPPPRHGFRLHLEPNLNVGLLPTLTLGLAGGVSLFTRDGWQLALSGSYGGKAKVELSPNAYLLGGNVLVSALVLDLSVCPLLLGGTTWGLSGCLGAAVVRRSFETPALAVHTDPSRYDLGPSIGLQGRLPLSELWHLRASAATAMPLPRERFVYQNGENVSSPVYTPARVFATFGVGLGTEL